MQNKFIQIGLGVFLSIFLITPAFAVVINGVPQDSGTVANPNQYYAATTTTGSNPNLNVTAGVNTNSYAPISVSANYLNGRWSEDTMRAYVSKYGVRIQSGVTLYGLGNFAVTGVVAMKKTVDYYTLAMRGNDRPLSELTIIRAAETYGIDSPSLDVASDTNLDYFIRHMATVRTADMYQLGDDYFFQTNGGWHIVFGPSNGTFVKNSVSFFGMVRDNFSVTHPTITDYNVPTAINFYRNLTIGSKGQDVNDLQKLLNTDPYTVLATTGVGAAGQETSYFGNLSKAAVIRWQYKYNEILDAAGITAPTGFFGPFTRASMTSYWYYLKALKTSPNQAALQYPTPTKPLEDVPLNADVHPTGTPTSGATTTIDQIVQNNTPTAPVYPGFDQDPGAWYLNNTPAFYSPLNNYGTQDPSNFNNSSNQAAVPSSQSGGQSSNQSFLGQIGQILTLSRLFGGSGGGLLGGGGGGGLFGGGSGAGINFGGLNTYTGFKGTPPCECPDSAAPVYVINNNAAYNSPSGSLGLLSMTLAITGGVISQGQCMIGKYAPPPTDAGTAFSMGLCIARNPPSEQNPDGCHPGRPAAGWAFNGIINPSLTSVKPPAACQSGGH